jgi:hypothetical protein
MWTRLVAFCRNWRRLSPAAAFVRVVQEQRKRNAEELLRGLQMSLAERERKLERIRAETMAMRNVREALEAAQALGDDHFTCRLRSRLREAVSALAEVSRLEE